MLALMPRIRALYSDPGEGSQVEEEEEEEEDEERGAEEEGMAGGVFHRNGLNIKEEGKIITEMS